MGVILGLVFIFPLVFVLMTWAYSKFRGSAAWRTVAWSDLIYCLTQDLIGLIALFGVPMILVPASAVGGIYQEIVNAAIPLIILIPPVMGAAFGYNVSNGYAHSLASLEISGRRCTLTALITAVFILCIQVLLGLTI